MKAIQVEGKGKGARLVIGEAPDPEPAPGEVRIRVHSTALNRADLLQKRGLYPPPPGISEILGLECSGVVEAVGEGVSEPGPGARVMALLAGGGYAEQVVVHAGSTLPIPEGMSFEEAAAVPEVFLTAYLNLLELGAVTEGNWVLIHGGGSGVGTACIQMLRRVGAHVIVTAGSPEKCARCCELGADVALNYREAEFADVVGEHTDGHGVDVVLDSIGGPYFEQNVRCLRTGGRLIFIGLMGGARAEVNLAPLLIKRLHVIGSTLRSRHPEDKAAIIQRFQVRCGEDLENGTLRPIVDRVLPLEQAEEAHQVLAQSDHFGKVVLRVR
jgi:putative PIG3 family NAD(P)H quinone oxidoreductase